MPGGVSRRVLVLPSIVVLLVACTPGPPRARGPGYGPRSDPFLAPRVAAGLDREEDPVHRLILIGDAGDPLPNDPTLATLGRWADVRASDTTVVFLGDNVYPAGLRDEDRQHGEAVLRQQLEATGAARIFLPGNHDWGFPARGPRQAETLANQQRFLERMAQRDRGDLDFLPKDGCPGPVARTLVPPGGRLAGGLTLLIVDFHWWLLPERERPVCAGVPDTTAFVALLRRELASRADQTVVIAAHHPLRSGGTHGGLTRGFWRDFGAGLYYRLYGPIQDLWEPGYADMIRVVSAVMAEAPPLAFAAGHDHALQVLEGGDAARLLIVSGAGSMRRITGVTALDETLFAHAHAGFVVLDFFGSEDAGDALLLRVVETGAAGPVFTLGLDLERGRTPAP